MKLQTKLIFSILPLLIGTILALTFWATNTTEKRIRESEYVHMSTVLNYYFEEMLEKPYMLLQKNGLENIQSFIEGYQTNALESIRDKYVVPSGSFLILDDFGKVLYNGKKDTHEVDVESAYVLLLTEIQGGNTGILRGHLQNEYFHDTYVYKRFAPWKWNIFVVKNDSVIHDTIRSINRGALGIGLVSSAFCLVFIIILIKRFIIRPINMLKNVAEKIALREPVPPWPIIRKDELGVLAGSIQQMSEEVSAYQAKLLSLQDKLEDQVRVRTEDLQNELLCRLQTQKALEKSEKLLLEVEEIASVGGIEFDLVSGKIKWTAQTYSILGCTEKESPLNSDEFIALFDSNSQRVLDAKLDSIFKGDEVSFVEVKRVVPNALSKWCKLILRGYYEDDTCTKINVIIQDITELKVVEENNRALHTELLQSHKLEAIGQLASGIAHEINTPAQFVASNINFLKDSYRDIEGVMQTLLAMQHGEQDATVLASGVAGLQDALIEADWEFLSSEIPSAIEQSQEGVDRISSIVQAMKEFSHPGSREKELKDVNAIIQNTITVARNEWKYVAEIELQLSELPEISCYAGELGQVILNIIVNAAHAISDKLGRTPDGKKGVITITTAVEQEWLKITISDTGSGIPEEVQQKIFDPFFTTKQVGKGSGQGLAIAYDVIVNKHSGNIKVTSKESSGAVFTLLLPI